MSNFFFSDFISRFDSQGAYACPCGDAHSIATRTVLLESGALEGSAALLSREKGNGAVVWVLSDENTESAAGERWKSLARTARTVSRVLPAEPKPFPTEDLVRAMEADARAASPDLLVSVGGGVISDVVKLVSLTTGIPNWCVATAPSVDAYTSATSALRGPGYSRAVPTGVSEVVICDLDVIARAPRELFLSGLGDLLAKFIAYLDWNLARMVTGEHYCPVVSDMALASARSALDAARQWGDRPIDAARTLTDAILASGFAMQATGSSRSAASGEHTLAHCWEMLSAVGNRKLELHGILTGAASRIMLHSYRAFYDALEGAEPDIPRRLSRFDGEPPWQEGMEEGLRPYMQKIREEMEGKTLDRRTLETRLGAFRRRKPEILDLAGRILRELSEAIDLLESLQFPFSLSGLGIAAESCTVPGRNIRLLRRRYSSFDLAYELGMEEPLHEALRRCVEADGGA